jgi:CRP-like cAMP-binding protein
MNNLTSTVLVHGNHFSKNPPIEGLTSTWKIFSDSGRKINIKSQEYLFAAGEKVEYVYIIISGYLALIKNDTILDVLGPGQSVGGALVGPKESDQIYPVTAQALGQCQLMQLPIDKVAELIQKENTVNAYFMTQFRQRMEHLQMCRSIQNRPVAQRIAHFLVQKKSILEHALITRKTIARSVNTTTETVIRTLMEFKKNQIIGYHGRHIILLDLKILEQLCAQI